MLAALEPDIPNLMAEELAGHLVFVPLGGSSLELWITRLKGFNRPEFYLTDRDNPPPQSPKYQQQIIAWTNRGCTAWVTSKRELENYLHVSTLIAAAPGYRGTGQDFDDVPLLFAEAIHSAALGVPLWGSLEEAKKKNKASAAKKRLNNEIAGQMTPELLSLADPANDLRQWLRKIGAALSA